MVPPSVFRLTDVKQSTSKWGIENLEEWHLGRLWHNLFNGSPAGTRLYREHIPDDKEHQFAFRAPGRMKATSRLVEALKGPEESFDAVGGPREGIVPEGGGEALEFLGRLPDPIRQPTGLCAVCGG